MLGVDTTITPDLPPSSYVCRPTPYGHSTTTPSIHTRVTCTGRSIKYATLAHLCYLGRTCMIWTSRVPYVVWRRVPPSWWSRRGTSVTTDGPGSMPDTWWRDTTPTPPPVSTYVSTPRPNPWMAASMTTMVNCFTLLKVDVVLSNVLRMLKDESWPVWFVLSETDDIYSVTSIL
jgi:hypothetical protein